MNFQSEQEYNDYIGAMSQAEGQANADASYAEYMQQQDASLTPTAILYLFQTNKEQRMNFIANLMEAIESGNIDPLKVHVQLKCIEDITFQMTSLDEKTNKNGIEVAKKFRKLLLDAAEAYGQKKFDYLNTTIEIKEVGTKYDWEKCEDPVLDLLLTEQEGLKAAIKKRQDFLKTVPTKGLTLLKGEIEDGDMITVFPPAKSSTTSIAVSLK